MDASIPTLATQTFVNIETSDVATVLSQINIAMFFGAAGILLDVYTKKDPVSRAGLYYSYIRLLPKHNQDHKPEEKNKKVQDFQNDYASEIELLTASSKKLKRIYESYSESDAEDNVEDLLFYCKHDSCLNAVIKLLNESSSLDLNDQQVFKNYLKIVALGSTSVFAYDILTSRKNDTESSYDALEPFWGSFWTVIPFQQLGIKEPIELRMGEPSYQQVEDFLFGDEQDLKENNDEDENDEEDNEENDEEDQEENNEEDQEENDVEDQEENDEEDQEENDEEDNEENDKEEKEENNEEDNEEKKEVNKEENDEEDKEGNDKEDKDENDNEDKEENEKQDNMENDKKEDKENNTEDNKENDKEVKEETDNEDKEGKDNKDKEGNDKEDKEGKDNEDKEGNDKEDKEGKDNEEKEGKDKGNDKEDKEGSDNEDKEGNVKEDNEGNDKENSVQDINKDSGTESLGDLEKEMSNKGPFGLANLSSFMSGRPEWMIGLLAALVCVMSVFSMFCCAVCVKHKCPRKEETDEEKRHILMVRTKK